MSLRRFGWLVAALPLGLGAACSSEPSNPVTPGVGGGGSAGSAPISSGGSAGSGGTALGGAGGLGGGAPTAGGSGGTSAGSTSGGSGAGTAGGGAFTGGSGGAGGSAGASAGAAGSGGGVALEPCAEPSVSRLKVWEMQVVSGTQVPANGSPLRAYAGGHELYVEWTLQGGGYGTANAPLNNRGQYTNNATPAEEAVDLSAADGFTIEYATTGNAYVQLRTGAVPHGGDHFRADIPNSAGQLRSVTLKFADFRRPGGNAPPGNDVLSDVFSFTFVAGGTTNLTLRQVLIPGFVPPCD